MNINIKDLIKITTKEEAQEYLTKLIDDTSDTQTILNNIGYLAGYCSEQEFVRITELFNCSHPIFGKTLPTPEEAFKMGQEFGEKMKNNEI